MGAVRRTKILCVEDHADSAELVVVLLGQYEVTIASCVNEAMYFAANERFDLCLLDYHLPDGDGVELFNLLRTLANGSAPVIFLTASTQLTRKEALDLGAVDLLNKGCLSFTNDLVDLVKRILPLEIPDLAPHVL